MVSFITCSQDENKINRLSESIACLGIAHEFCVKPASLGIAAAYNLGRQQARGDTLVFVHDDVKLLGNRLAWQVVDTALADPRTGFVGVAGTAQLRAHGCWWDSEPKCMRGAVLHDSAQHGTFLSSWPQNGAARFGSCVVLDGVFLAVRPEVLTRIGGFDETYGGFDFYDVATTFAAYRTGLRNVAVPFPLSHRAGRPLGPVFDAARKRFVAQCGEFLPARVVIS